MLKDWSKSTLGTGLFNKKLKKNLKHQKTPQLLVKIIIKAKAYNCLDSSRLSIHPQFDRITPNFED